MVLTASDLGTHTHTHPTRKNIAGYPLQLGDNTSNKPSHKVYTYIHMLGKPRFQAEEQVHNWGVVPVFSWMGSAIPSLN